MNTSMAINPMWFIFITLLVSLIPIILGVCTSYLKISIVLTLLRNGFGTQQFPGNILILVLSFSLSLFIMYPVYEESHDIAKSFQNVKLQEFKFNDAMDIFKKISVPWKNFMLKHSGKKELALLVDIKKDIVKKHDIEKSKESNSESNKESNNESNNESYKVSNKVSNKEISKEKNKENNKEIVFKDGKEVLNKNLEALKVQKEELKTRDEESFPIVLLAFLFSELKEAFAMSVSLLIPFLIIDIIVANILVGLGMYMLTPSLVSLPLKILIFVLIDGWLLLGKSLILSFLN
ncbi:MAG: hypothetical protein ACOX3T_03345 [Bdellovibrionota bacterium]